MNINQFKTGETYQGWLVLEVKPESILATKDIDSAPVEFSKKLLGGCEQAKHDDIALTAVDFDENAEVDLEMKFKRSFVDAFRNGFLSYDRFIDGVEHYRVKIEAATDKYEKLKLQEECANLKFKYYDNAAKKADTHAGSKDYLVKMMEKCMNELLDARDAVLEYEEKHG